MRVLIGVVAAFAAICPGPGPAEAGTVVLGDGTVLEGDVSREADWVAIRSETGTLRLPVRRVAVLQADSQDRAPQVEPPRAAAAAPEADAGGEEAQADGVGRAPGRSSSRPPRAAAVLESKMDVDFDGVSVYEVVSFVQINSGVNMAVANVVREDRRPVTLHLKNVPVATILELALEPLGFGYTVKPGDIIDVRGSSAGAISLRIYNVRDLLLDVGDRRGRGDDDDDDDDNASNDNADDDVDRAGGTYARARELADLIRMACGSGTWQQGGRIAAWER